MDGPYALIVNVKSGRRKRERLEKLHEDLSQTLDSPVELLPVRGGEGFDRAIDKARRSGVKTLFVAGGDGTISGIAERLKGSDIAMAPLPMGTFNFFARAHGIPETAEEAVAALTSGRVVTVAAGEVNGRLFLNNASVGLYPAILAERETVYRNWGRSRIAAYWSVVKTLFRGGHRMKLKLSADGTDIPLVTPMIFAASNAFQLDHFGLEGSDAVRQGRLVVFTGTDPRPLGMIATAIRLALGRARRDAEFVMHEGTEFVIDSGRRRLSVAIDGERIRLPTPLRLRIRHDALRVVVPAQSVKDRERAA
jgi:diacylglycerol kinase family enzyme